MDRICLRSGNGTVRPDVDLKDPPRFGFADEFCEAAFVPFLLSVLLRSWRFKARRSFLSLLESFPLLPARLLLVAKKRRRSARDICENQRFNGEHSFTEEFVRCIGLVATEQYWRLRSRGRRAVLFDNDGHACRVSV